MRCNEFFYNFTVFIVSLSHSIAIGFMFSIKEFDCIFTHIGLN